MVVYRSRFLTRAEVWFDHEPGDTRRVDWIFYQMRSRPVPGAKWRYCYALLIDLSPSPEALLAQLNPDTAYEIRRARDRDKVTCETLDPGAPGVLDQFEEVYNQFAPLKGLPPLDRSYLNSLAAAGVLDVSVARDAAGNALVYHANYRDRHRASGLHWPSLYRKLADSAARNAVGRAHRYLLWNDMLRYREQGLRAFDFGGWFYRHPTQEMRNINHFKTGFGGQVVREYQCEQIVSLKGWLVLTAAQLLKRVRLLSARPPSAVKPASA